jgi:hypothetical protein
MFDKLERWIVKIVFRWAATVAAKRMMLEEEANEYESRSN